MFGLANVMLTTDMYRKLQEWYELMGFSLQPGGCLCKCFVKKKIKQQKANILDLEPLKKRQSLKKGAREEEKEN